MARVHSICGTEVVRETEEALIREYGPWVCPKCDENLYTQLETRLEDGGVKRSTYRAIVTVTADDGEDYDSDALAADIRDKVFEAVAQETPLTPVLMMVDGVEEDDENS